jgi:hypothetical protein
VRDAEVVCSLSGETFVIYGNGPETTVGREKISHPFVFR